MNRRTAPLALCAALLAATPACTRIDEIYYVSTHDPENGVDMYYRVRITGQATAGKVKYSVGFYDRTAVERLFAENTIEREYLSTKVDLFDAETGKRLTDLTDQLERTARADRAIRRAHAEYAHATVAGLLGIYSVRLDARPSLKQEYDEPLKRARQAWTDAGQRLGLAAASTPSPASGETATEGTKVAAAGTAKPAAGTTKEAPPVTAPPAAGDPADKVTDSDVTAAVSSLREAQSLLETIRVTVDGHALVRHFDGAGNEIDTNARTLVIFVASDVSRFSEAIRQLAESQETTKSVINIVLGRKAAEAVRLHEQGLRFQNGQLAVGAYMEKQLADVGDDATAARLKETISSFAQAVTGKPGGFESAAEIRAFAEGME